MGGQSGKASKEASVNQTAEGKGDEPRDCLEQNIQALGTASAEVLR